MVAPSQTQASGIGGWVKIVLGTMIVLCSAGLIAWGALRSTVGDHERRIDQAEKNVASVAKIQNDDGRKLSAMESDIKSVLSGIEEIKTELREMRP